MASRPPPPPRPPDPAPLHAVAARLLRSTPDGALVLEFSPPPVGRWTLVRAELARRLAEQAVSEAALLAAAELEAFAVGRAVPVRRVTEPAPATEPTASGPAVTGSDVARLRAPDMLTGDALAKRLGVSRATVALRRSAGKLLALESGAKRGFRFPAWQAALVADVGLRASFEAVLALLGRHGSWATYQFLTDASPALGADTPLDRLRVGDGPAVRRAAAEWAGPSSAGARAAAPT